MTRYYYSDQLKAAYMAREFGMRFLRPDGSEVNLSHGMGREMGDDGWIEFIAVPNDGDYIHPDSLSILQPQEGDLVEASTETEQYTFYYHAEMLAKSDKIIQRQGKAFFWPEREDS